MFVQLLIFVWCELHNKDTDLALGSVYTWARDFVSVDPTHSLFKMDQMGFVGAILGSLPFLNKSSHKLSKLFDLSNKEWQIILPS